MAGAIRKMSSAVPLARLLVAAQVLMLARSHWQRLAPYERRRLLSLVRMMGIPPTHGRGLSVAERAELARLIAKADPRLFAGLVAQRFSPVPLPRRVVRGKR